MAQIEPPPGAVQNPAGESPHQWGMVVDIDRCTGCQACVVACQAENNVPINDEQHFLQHRSKEWIRVERYWEIKKLPDGTTDTKSVKARFLPVLCQHCQNAPCEPVCPVYAIYHSNDGLNVQVYNRCVGTRYCANNCQWNVRFFNFEDADWPEPLGSQLNPDVTVRVKGLIEKCTFCIHRIMHAKRNEKLSNRLIRDGDVQPACAQACPTDALVFGDWKEDNSRINRLARDQRSYQLLGELGTEPVVVYLKKVDPNAAETPAARR
ncbi:MAG TPA: 4Fe-4S dicluster domain-containing protein [Chloroflexota bacterium]|nr:4Fe-4S dicluster domain-containing protein [Chloroflexota bacterium]